MKISDMEKFKEPFPAEDIEWRLQSCGNKNGRLWGKALAYITSRAVQERLDAVCGPDGWQCDIRKDGDAYLCTLSVRVEHEDGSIEWLKRTDGADSTDIEAVKGGISGAIKRAAVLFGIGRYLYNLKDNWAVISDGGKYSGKTKDGSYFNWDPPVLPEWALPTKEDFKEDRKEKVRREQAATPMSEAAQREKKQSDTKEFVDLSLKLDQYIESGVVPKEKLKDIEKAKEEKNVRYMRMILDWCIKQTEQNIA